MDQLDQIVCALEISRRVHAWSQRLGRHGPVALHVPLVDFPARAALHRDPEESRRAAARLCAAEIPDPSPALPDGRLANS
jgi:hypothetical protein